MGNAVGVAHRAMVRVPGDTLWFERDERGHVGCELVVDARVRLSVP
jgi:hypothetical protein